LKWLRTAGSLVLIVSMTWAGVSAKQTDIDPKRKQQIRVALQEHGYPPGANWGDTMQVMKQIARDHHWQVSHVPDARVLILIGLADHANPWVTGIWSHLDY